MIERTDGFVSSIKQNTLSKVVSHTLHGDRREGVGWDSDIHPEVDTAEDDVEAADDV
jgi:hypothetical protein